MEILGYILALMIGKEVYDTYQDVTGLHKAAVIYNEQTKLAKAESDKHKAAALLIGNIYRQQMEQTNFEIEHSTDPCSRLPDPIADRMVGGWWEILKRPDGVPPDR